MMFNGLLDFFNGAFRVAKLLAFVFALVVPGEPDIGLVFRKLIFAFVVKVCPFNEFLQFEALEPFHDGHVVFDAIDVLFGAFEEELHHFFRRFLNHEIFYNMRI